MTTGGRIFKNENYQLAIKRILKNEVGILIKDIKYKIIGIYDPIYSDNVLEIKKINTHYFVCAIKFNLKMDKN